MSLIQFENIKKSEVLEPVWKKTAETRFLKVDKEGIISGCLFKILDDTMYFNLNWDIDKKEVIPLKRIVKLINKPIQVDVIFHDVKNVDMYKVRLFEFKFTEILEPIDYEWGTEDIKELKVKFEYKNKEIIFLT